MMRKPKKRLGLAGLLFSGLAFLFPGKAKAETLEFPVEFRDPVHELISGKSQDATFKAETSRIENDFFLTVSGRNCEIIPGSLNVRFAMPASIESNAEIVGIKQLARVKNYGLFEDEEAIQELSENESFVKIRNGLAKLSDFGIKKVLGRIPFVDDAYNLLKDVMQQRERLSEEEAIKRLKGFELTQIPLFYPGYLDMFKKNTSRTFEIKVSEDPRFAYVVISAVVEGRGRVGEINSIILGFGETSLKPETEARIRGANPQGLARPNVPKSLEAFLLNDPELRFTRYIGPAELGRALEIEIKDSHILTYIYNRNKVDLKTEVLVQSRRDDYSPEIGDRAIHENIIGGRGGFFWVPGGIMNRDYVVWLVFSLFPENYNYNELTRNDLSLPQIPRKTRSELKRKIFSIIDFFKAKGNFQQDTGMQSLQNLDESFEFD